MDSGRRKTAREAAGYLFGDWRLEADGRIVRGEEQVELPPSELSLLRVLLARAGRVVTFSELRRAMAATRHGSGEPVHEAVAAQALASLRRRLGLSDCIETVYKRGYRLVCDVKPLGGGGVAAHSRVFTAAGKAVVRLAILPLDAHVGVAPYLAEAVAADTARSLSDSGIDSLELVEFDSVRTLSGCGMSPVSVGAAAGADLVLSGAMRQAAGGWRVHIAMVEVAGARDLWVEDLLVPRDEASRLAERLAGRLTNRLGLDSGISVAASAGESPVPAEAHELLWRARSERRELQRHQMQDSLRRLQHAVELAPHWIEARLELADLCFTQVLYGFIAPAVGAEAIRRAASTDALRSPGGLALLPLLGCVAFHLERDLDGARRAFERSAHLSYSPALARARTMFALSLHPHSEEPVRLFRDFLRLDPYAPWLHAGLGWALHLAGRSGDSVKQMEAALEKFPESERVLLFAQMVLAFNGREDRAAGLAEELVRRCPYLDPALSAKAYVLAQAGHFTEARDALEQLQWLSRERFVLRSLSAAAYLALGDPETAMRELRLSSEICCPWFFQIMADPRLQPLHGRPDFRSLQAILPRMEAAHGGPRQADAGSGGRSE